MSISKIGLHTPSFGVGPPEESTGPTPDWLPSVLHSTFNAMRSQVAILDREGVVRFANLAWGEFARRAGAKPLDSIGANYLAVCERAALAGEPDGAAVRDRLGELIAGRRERFAYSYECGKHCFHAHFQRFELGGDIRILTTHEDITDIARVQAELAVANARILSIQEEERRQIARDIHDSTSQHLAVVSLGLARLERRGVANELLQDMRLAVAKAAKEVRSLSYLLHPHDLLEHGLVMALGGLISGYNTRSGMTVTLNAEGAVDTLSEDLQLAIFRVVQEALMNVHRHANARRVSVRLAVSKGGLALVVEDDGDGAGPRVAGDTPRLGVGIASMQARMRQFGGNLAVTFERGTSVEVSIPADMLASNRVR